MKHLYKRVLASLLAVMMLFCAPVQVLAETPGSSFGSTIPAIKPGGSGYLNNPDPIFRDYGFRITLTTSAPMDGVITPLEGAYTHDQLNDQRTAVMNICNTRYWEPDNDGLYFWKALNSGIKPNYGVNTSMPGTKYKIKDYRQTMSVKATVTNKDNVLAWLCYPGTDLPRDQEIPCNMDMYNTVIQIDPATYATADDWLFHIKTMFNASGYANDYKDAIRRMISDGNNTVRNIQEFTWDTILFTDGTAQDRVLWSRIGYETMLIQLAWYAQDIGDLNTYEMFKNKIWNWVNDDFSQASMPILMIEACQEVSEDGTSTASNENCMLVTMPFTLNAQYGTDMSEQLYAEWPADVQGNTTEAIKQFTNFRSPLNTGYTAQGLGYYVSGGIDYPKYADRAFHQLLKPVTGNENVYGYLIGFTYSADCPMGKYNAAAGAIAEVPGSFTWKLTPRGIHDVTPDTEVNSSSTVYDINMSQNSYNKNNYNDWVAYVNSNGKDKNKIRINVYRISDPLDDDEIAKEYSRNNVISGGKDVNTVVDRVVLGSGNINNVPVLGTVGAGKESRELTNEELLTILREATGMSYGETIVGSLEQKGIRVTYAVTVDVKVGNKSWQSFTNDQVDFVEYRSIPGVYSYQSDSPDGFAEIKCGYFDKSYYTEPFEAMAGVPTTENLYFASGGQEFVAQLKYEYVTDKNTVREYEQKYSAQQCEAYWEPCTKEFSDATIDDINSWLRANTDAPSQTGEFVTESVCDTCGTVHHNGVGAEKIIKTSITGGITGSDEPRPGGYYTELSLHAVRWDWHSDSDSHEIEVGEDEEGNPVTEDCDLPAGDAYDVADPGTPPSCDCGDLTGSWYKTKATRYSGTVKSYHVEYNDGDGHTNNQASINWQQDYTNMNYAKIKEAHVWRLERSRVEGIKQLTFKEDDYVLGIAEDLTNVIFNVAEEDNAKEGRMWYSIHPTDGDYYTAKTTIPTRGCCNCYNHNAAEDIIDSAENPNEMFEEAWCISDYLILEGTRATTSLLYHQYETLNDAGEIPIMDIRVSGTDGASRQDNGYYIIKPDGTEEFRGIDEAGQRFTTRPVSFNTEANAINGTEEAICQNSETYVGADIDSGDLSWGGYNGKYSATDVDLAAGTDDVESVGKYRGRSGVSNFKGARTKKIFAQGYEHNNQGEVNGFSTDSPQKLEYPDSPFVLVVNDIDMDDFEVHNGIKSFHDSTIFYHNIITFGPSPKWSIDEDEVYTEKGFHVDTGYYSSAEGINDILVHDPVSTQDAKIIPLPSELDQRVYDVLISDQLNQNDGKCPGRANACKYAHLNCEYADERYHVDECYVKVRGQGLASLPVGGSAVTTMKPVTVTKYISGSKTFGYTGADQTFTAPGNGTYTFECWGAQGGAGELSIGGQGAYTKGTYTLKKDQKIYIHVGQQGHHQIEDAVYGGGGPAGATGSLAGGSGGGATDIRVGGNGTANRVIVAAGGGGGSHYNDGTPGGSSTSTSVTSGSAVGETANRHSGGGGGGAPGGSSTGDCKGIGYGGSNYIAGVKNGVSQRGGREGNGLCKITWTNATIDTIEYVSQITGQYTYDNTQATVIGASSHPEVYTAQFTGYHSIHLYGARGGGQEAGKASAGGLGGYAAGQIYLTKGEQLLVTAGGMGSDGATVGAALSGGYNGGGNSHKGFGGGGATDVAKVFTYHNGVRMNTMTSGGTLSGTTVSLTRPGAYYDGPRVAVKQNAIIRVDVVGEKLNKAAFTPNTGTLIHSLVTDNYAQFFYKIGTATSDFRVKIAGNSVASVKEIYLLDMADRLLVAGAGGGADNAAGTLNGSDDGRGGKGGGLSGGNGYTNGQESYLNGGAQASSGYQRGLGQDSASGDGGGGGAGWYGGFAGQDGNSGGGGGSSYLGNCQYSITKEGQNKNAGYAVIILPGMGDTDFTHMLSCSEPHHAPNSNWHRYTDGWIHDGGYVCTGVTCPWCAQDTPLTSPAGYYWETAEINAHGYIIEHDGEYHLTYGDDTHCDACGKDVVFDTYSLDGKTSKSCVWKTTSYDAACFDTQGATNTEYHYAFGDEMCYDACMDDNNHKINDDLVAKDDQPATAGQFIILDNDFQVYFPDIGDFYGNGSLALRNTQKPEGYGYIDRMCTTPWVREKYVAFPFDVTYNGTTYLAGEKILLGYWDSSEMKWVDDNPDDFTYDFHCLLSNSEFSACEISFVAKAINTPIPDSTENYTENRNYTRYGKNKRAYHDASRNYFIDVLGRIGVLSMIDTGDFRFSNYYKQVVDSWRVDQVVKNVDVSKQNFVTVDQETIFGDPISENTKGQNTWGLTDWLEPMDKLQEFPLTPGKNNVPALRNQAHRIGYNDYMSLVTIGNYYGENTEASNNMYKVQIQPFYYHYNLLTKEWNPVDVYIKTGDSYKMINKYGSLDSTTEYNYYYNMDWEAEKARRMYTAEEEAATRTVQQNWYTLWNSESESTHIRVPNGINCVHGTANMLFLRDGNRTFIGSKERYGVNTEPDSRIPEANFNRQAQRWHFTLGLPSSAGFVKAGSDPTPENMKALDMDNGIILCALQIYAKGTVWTLKYDGVAAGDRSFYLFDGNRTLVSWESAGEAGPQDKQVVAVYTDAKTSRNDLLTEGSH